MLEFAFFIFLQIVSESFPISSSGHITLVLLWLQAHEKVLFEVIWPILSSPAVVYALHAPTALVITLFYAPRWYHFLFRIIDRWRLLLKMSLYTLVANVLTVLIVLFIKLNGISIPLWLGFFITLLLLLSTRWQFGKDSTMDFQKYALLGLVQGMAYVPGVSRLAAVYATARLVGLPAQKAFDMAWLLQFPLILGAATFGWLWLALKGKTAILLSGAQLKAMILGTIISLLGFCVMKYVATRHLWWLWAFYIVVPLVLSLVYGMNYCL